MHINAHPLTWPEGWKRTPAADRLAGRFGKREAGTGGYRLLKDLTVNDSIRRVLEQLLAMGLSRDDLVISTNVPVRLDGLPRSDAKAPADPGVSVWWRDFLSGGKPKVIAIDQYAKVADNLAAIAATLEAMRAIERHGGAAILERAFTGFIAIENQSASSWRAVIGVGPGVTSIEEVRAAYRRKASVAHPDKPNGSHEAMTALNSALAQAEQEINHV